MFSQFRQIRAQIIADGATIHITTLPPCVMLHQQLTVIETSCRGHATSGELGYGPGGKKSSAQPDKVPALEGANTHMVRSRL